MFSSSVPIRAKWMQRVVTWTSQFLAEEGLQERVYVSQDVFDEVTQTYEGYNKVIMSCEDCMKAAPVRILHREL